METKHWLIIAVYLFVLITTNVFTYSQGRADFDGNASLFSESEGFESESLESPEDIAAVETAVLKDALDLTREQQPRVRTVLNRVFKKMFALDELLSVKYDALSRALDGAEFDEVQVRKILTEIDRVSLDERVLILREGSRIREILNPAQREAFRDEFHDFLRF